MPWLLDPTVLLALRVGMCAAYMQIDARNFAGRQYAEASQQHEGRAPENSRSRLDRMVRLNTTGVVRQPAASAVAEQTPCRDSALGMR